MFIVIRKEHITLAALLLVLVITVSVFGILSNNNDLANKEVDGEISIVDGVIIDAGHGGEDPGAVSDTLGIKEKDINLIIAKKVEELLKAENINVMLSRSEDKLTYPEGTEGYTAKRKADLYGRKSLIDASKAKCVVSIHLNKFPDTKYWGAQAFFPHNSTESESLAKSIQDHIKLTADPQNSREALVRGKANELPIVLFNNLVVPTVVVECGFLSNTEDEKRLATEEYQQKLAISIKDGILTYLGKATPIATPAPTEVAPAAAAATIAPATTTSPTSPSATFPPTIQ